MTIFWNITFIISLTLVKGGGLFLENLKLVWKSHIFYRNKSFWVRAHFDGLWLYLYTVGYSKAIEIWIYIRHGGNQNGHEGYTFYHTSSLNLKHICHIKQKLSKIKNAFH